jgi:hypothetical protein
MSTKTWLSILLAGATGACGATSGRVLYLVDGGSSDSSMPPPDAADSSAPPPDGADGSLAEPDASDALLPSPDGSDGSIPSADAADATTLDAADTADADAADASDAELDASCSVSLDSDPLNCGRCGHGCLGAPCVEGLCQPILLASGPMPFSVVIDDTRVYWCSAATDPGEVRSVAKDGSNPQTIATGVHAPQGVFVDSTNVFWNEANAPGRAFKANKDGSNPVLLSTSNTTVQGLVADADWVYFLDLYVVGGLVKAPRNGVPEGGAPLVVSGGWPYVWGVAQDSANVYWSSRGTIGSADDGGIRGKLLRAPKDGSTPTVLELGSYGGAALGGPVFVAVDSDQIYWTDEGNDTVYRAALDGGAPTPLAVETSLTYAISIDATDVYYTTLGPGAASGSIVRVPKDGSGPPTVIAKNLSFPSPIAIDDTAIYWGNTNGGTVMKLAK